MIYISAKCFVRVDNYENSVYILRRPLSSQFEKLEETAYFDPTKFDYISVTKNTERELPNGEKKNGMIIECL